MNYVYDGSFFGFLSVIFDAYHDGINSVGAIQGQQGSSLFDEERYVYTDMAKVQRVLMGMQEQCGAKACHFLYYAFLAEQPKREQKLLAYIRRAFLLKKEFLHHLSEPAVWEVRRWAAKTGNERHKLLGLLRFRELTDGMLYARLAPDCNVVSVMAPHFARRLSGETWVIHDVRRHFGVLYRKGELSTVEIPETLQDIELSDTEEALTSLWKRYYTTIAIKERRNAELRRQFMPKKYWPYLIEMN